MSAPAVFVHVVLARFHEACRTLSVGSLFGLNERLDAVLARHAPGFRKPSVDEAVFAGEPPWRRTGEPGSALDFGASLRNAISFELHLESSVGIAATGVAARLAARLARPGGVLFWMPGREKELLDGIPLEELDELRPEQLDRLRSRGIVTLDAFAGLGPSDARALLGFEGERLLGLVRGVDSSVDPPIGSRTRATLALLAERLSRRLERGRFRARGLELAIEYASGVTRERHTHLRRPTSSSEDLAEAAYGLWQNQSLSAESVAGLSLTATGLDCTAQLGLFGSPGPREVRVALGRVHEPGIPIDTARGEPVCSPDTGGTFP